LVFSILFATNCLAQFNLQFNQIKRVKITGNVSSSVNTKQTAGSITVPANKVWKIESGSFATSSSPYHSSLLLVDDQILQVGIYNQPASTTYNMAHAPIWLPAGTYNIEYLCSLYLSNLSYAITISAIEYNLTP
jgi:hypothetical protein